MNQALVDRIAQAVLYEGYILYPYRPSVKNHQRWTFGGLYPRAYRLAQGDTEPCAMQTECVVRGSAALQVTVRFLHLRQRLVGELTRPPDELANAEPAFRVVESLAVGARRFYTWQEALERTVCLEPCALEELVARPRRQQFAFPAAREWEPLRDPGNAVAGIVVREQHAIEGVVESSALALQDGLFRVRVRIENLTPLDTARHGSRDEALLRSLVSTHTILGVRDGEFVSLFDTPLDCRAAVAECRNEGTWPVLVGEAGATDTLLSAPIILYDYPEVAPESAGDLFDSTEIDEILTLRILTLTESEKQAMAAVDERARALLHRTESLTAETMLGLHGTMRGVRALAAEGDRGDVGSVE